MTLIAVPHCIRQERFLCGLVSTRPDSPISPADREVGNKSYDDDQEHAADGHGREAQAAVLVGLGEIVAHRSAKRSGEDVGRPKSEHWIEDLSVVAKRNQSDEPAKDEPVLLPPKGLTGPLGLSER